MDELCNPNERPACSIVGEPWVWGSHSRAPSRGRDSPLERRNANRRSDLVQGEVKWVSRCPLRIIEASRAGTEFTPPTGSLRRVEYGLISVDVPNIAPMVNRMINSVEVSWLLDDIKMYATLMLPDGDGPFPAVVLVAGSGPTDRDWCSPLLSGSNGSGRLFAQAFADAGIASLRYDKRASGPGRVDNARILSGKFSMQSHLEELTAAVTLLAGHGDIDTARIVGLGNSEGALHVLHYATGQHDVPFAGIVLAAPPGRSVGEVLLSQLALQASQVPGGAAMMVEVEAAMNRYGTGLRMDLDPGLPDNVKLVLESFESPVNLPLARELWAESAANILAAVEIPTLVLIGRKDLQVDAALDGDALERAGVGKGNVTFAYPANANHVFKEDARLFDEVLTAPANGYNEVDTHLDPEALRTILGWLRQVFA